MTKGFATCQNSPSLWTLAVWETGDATWQTLPLLRISTIRSEEPPLVYFGHNKSHKGSPHLSFAVLSWKGQVTSVEAHEPWR